MGSKGDRQDGLAGVGVNRVPPGFARPSRDASDPFDNRAASRVPANPVDVRIGEPVAASMGRSTAQSWHPLSNPAKRVEPAFWGTAVTGCRSCRW
jgi:hypothetical protein